MPGGAALNLFEDHPRALHQVFVRQMPQGDGIRLKRLSPSLLINLIGIYLIGLFGRLSRRFRLGFVVPAIRRVAFFVLATMAESAFAGVPTRKGLLSRHGCELSMSCCREAR